MRNIGAQVELLALMGREVGLLSARELYSINIGVVKTDADTVGIQNSIVGTEGDYMPAMLRVFFVGQFAQFVRRHINDCQVIGGRLLWLDLAGDPFSIVRPHRVLLACVGCISQVGW